jgi:hypothetical protein
MSTLIHPQTKAGWEERTHDYASLVSDWWVRATSA